MLPITEVKKMKQEMTEAFEAQLKLMTAQLTEQNSAILDLQE